ncbi:[SSU ribosomal protein S18P]-alanine acetyltransferase [Fontimonas thermophila]|uniref:[Ribosomal protein bS18]-alanine N-acetyltransferase n=1 Tax=Fontimonas thermophila TaxID=1076937 RepID=A0A1I2IRT6_9GAMM|nr:ribosomal protein S18-alanine N-acetyltransferase [Fontimonas thermophila]SFF44358.1 [SSU ribosomal protein S18P]-alanine acetyltransferase [Fontimonas thermophila]
MSAQPHALWRLQPMQPAHLGEVLRIERESYAFPWTEGIFRDCLHVGYSAWVVVDPTGAVLAYALMSMAAGEAHILNICVAPQQRRRGLAQFLLRHLIMVARASGVTLLLLEVRKSNAAAQKLYARFGFNQLGERRAYYPAHDGREDALVLGLDL